MFCQVLNQFISIHIVQQQRILMIYMCTVRSNKRNRYSFIVGKCFIIVVGSLLPGSNVFIEVPQFYIENCRLYTVEPGITTHHFVVIPNLLSMISYHFQLQGKVIVVRENCTTVSVGAEVF